ncbi:hypothetical protein [Streptomyces sp. S186]|uniref:hypothetical protein n=1 Tax=Streptomyces sp. S186 TaxID=3434395 RepID=UPI003F66991A
MPRNPVVTLVDDNSSSIGGTTTVPVTAGAGTVVVKAAPGRLCRVVVTAAGTTGAVTFYDNASSATGTVLAVVPGSAAVGALYEVQMPAANGIVVAAAASSVALTVAYS